MADYEKMAREWLARVVQASSPNPRVVEEMTALLKRVAHQAKEEQRERDEKIARHHSDEYRYPSRKYGASTKEEDNRRRIHRRAEKG